MSRGHYLFGAQKSVWPCHRISSRPLLERRRAPLGEVVLGNEALDPSSEGADALRNVHGVDMNAQCRRKGGDVELKVAMFTCLNKGGEL
jgi:hypothetical protein